MTENQIKENIDNPAQLELLFRNDKKGFQKAFILFMKKYQSIKLQNSGRVDLSKNFLPLSIEQRVFQKFYYCF
jgi:hypothetical protein